MRLVIILIAVLILSSVAVADSFSCDIVAERVDTVEQAANCPYELKYVPTLGQWYCCPLLRRNVHCCPMRESWSYSCRRELITVSRSHQVVQVCALGGYTTYLPLGGIND